MQQIQQRLESLFLGYRSGTLTEDETIEFFNLVEKYPHVVSSLGKETLSKDFPLQHSLKEHSKDLILETILAVVRERDVAHSSNQEVITFKRRNTGKKWFWAAASVAIFTLASIFFLVPGGEKADLAERQSSHEEIPAGINGAVLTLADGRNILLDSMENGVVSMDYDSKAELVDGVLLYEPNVHRTGNDPKSARYNTITTPNGRHFHLKLSDGTAVWLNAASSIRYPSFFSGERREVEITGEVYFEVAENSDMPFRVSVNEQAVVEVLGTHFNVKAFESDKNIATTLFEGRIRIKKSTVANNSYVNVRPGQQAQISTGIGSGSDVKILDGADLQQVIAWKNGLFNFENVGLLEIMRQFERWYDVEVRFENGVPDIALSGKLNRGVSLNDLLPALEKMGLNYKLQGRTLTILN